MRRLVHISDLHFGRVDAAVVAALSAEIRADRPDLVIVSGDLSMRARTRELCEARAFLDGLGAPSLAVPGNHDVPSYQTPRRFIDPFGQWRRFIAPETGPVWRDEELLVIGVNTARRAALHWDWSRGRISRSQIERVTGLLQAAPDHLFRIVVGHHPFAPPEAAPRVPIAGRADEALAAFARCGVRLVLAGHLHRAYIRPPRIPRRRAALTQPPGSPLLVVQASTATSTRLRKDPNAYNRITIADGSATIESRIWTGRTWTTAPPQEAALPIPVPA